MPYYVYMMTNRSGTLYIGVTNNLERRIHEHKTGEVKGFTSRYNLNRLVFWEETGDVMSALEREKPLKGWVRRRKVALIQSQNPRWLDLSESLFPEG